MSIFRENDNSELAAAEAAEAQCAKARSAESPADFIHKLKIAVKELNENEVWLHIIVASDMLSAKRLSPLIDECNQLQRILSTSIKIARKSADRCFHDLIY